MPNDQLPSIIPFIRQLVEYANLPEDQENRLLTKLSDGRIDTLTYDEGVELLSVMDVAQNKVETAILDTNDPDQISELTRMKKYLNELLFEAEKSALQNAAGDVDLESVDIQDHKYDPKYLLDRLAGIVE